MVSEIEFIQLQRRMPHPTFTPSPPPPLFPLPLLLGFHCFIAGRRGRPGLTPDVDLFFQEEDGGEGAGQEGPLLFDAAAW